jgi:hypothetical protein
MLSVVCCLLVMLTTGGGAVDCNTSEAAGIGLSPEVLRDVTAYL